MLSYQTINAAPEGISIIAIGGAGANVLRHLAPSDLPGVQLFCTALDTRLSGIDEAVEFIQLGSSRYHGLGSGGDPSVAKAATLQSLDNLHTCVLGNKLVVLVCGLGGGTGSGVAPVIAEMAELAGAMVAAVVVMPFEFEGERRRKQAEQALSDIRAHSNLVLCFENDEMEDLMDSYGSAKELFNASATMMAKAAACLPTMITSPGLIHIGLDELQACVSSSTSSLFAAAEAEGENRVEDVLNAAFQSPMMNESSLSRMGNQLLAHVTGDENLSLKDIRCLLEEIKSRLGKPDLEILFGLSTSMEWEGRLKINLLAACTELAVAEKPALPLVTKIAEPPVLAPVPEPELVPAPEPIPAFKLTPKPEPEPELNLFTTPPPAKETLPLFELSPEPDFSLNQAPEEAQVENEEKQAVEKMEEVEEVEEKKENCPAPFEPEATTSPYDEHPYPEPDYPDEYSNEYGDALDTPPSMRATERPSWAQFD